MKKIILITAIMFVSLFATQADAATANVTLSNKVLFEVNLKAVNKIASTNRTKFDYEIANIKNSGLIDHWKLRLKCQGGAEVRLNQITTDLCGKVQVFSDIASIKNFSLYMTRKVEKKGTGFSFKFAAYDKNGKWLHSEAENVRW